jgi:hypothetical protein
MSLSIVVTLFVAGALLAAVVFVLMRDKEASKRRVESLFRRPPKTPKAPGSDHYYRPYWS